MVGAAAAMSGISRSAARKRQEDERRRNQEATDDTDPLPGNGAVPTSVVNKLMNEGPVAQAYTKIAIYCDRLTEWNVFQNFIIFVILVAAVLVGLDTYAYMREHFGAEMEAMDLAILVIFTLEVALKTIACNKRPWAYFIDHWNKFDCFIVAVCYLPFDASGAKVLRLLRLLRVLKLVKALPQLQMLVGGLLKSLSSIVYIALLLSLLFYIYAVVACTTFNTNDPRDFGSLHITFLTLFRVSTLESWGIVMYRQLLGCDAFPYDYPEDCSEPDPNPIIAPLFFVSFVIFSSMIVLNLFIGVITTAINEAKMEQEAALAAEQVDEAQQEDGEAPGGMAIQGQLVMLTQTMEMMQQQLQELKVAVEKDKKKRKSESRARPPQDKTAQDKTTQDDTARDDSNTRSEAGERVTGPRNPASPPGISTGHLHRASPPGISTGHLHRASPPGISTGAHFGTGGQPSCD